MSARKRATGFALMDAAFAADAKFLKLWRVTRTPKDYAAAVGVFWIILADCRRSRESTVGWDDYSDYPDELSTLRDVGLLTPEGFDSTVFERWAPAYRSPSEVRKGTQGYATVPPRTGGTPTSVHINSNGDRGAGEEEPENFMRWPAKKQLEPEPGAAFLPRHEGQHPNCTVCATVAPA